LRAIFFKIFFITFTKNLYDFTISLIYIFYLVIHDFAEISKNLARYTSENNFVENYQLYRTFKLIDRISKFFTILLIMLEFPTLFWWSNKIISRSS